mgnify:CR=1 FL=1
MPKIIVLSNLQANLIGVLNLFLRYVLVIAAGLYIAQTWNNWGVAILTVLAYLATEAYMFYSTDQQDVVFMERVKEDETDEDQDR